jgi:hypothetical protein
MRFDASIFIASNVYINALETKSKWNEFYLNIAINEGFGVLRWYISRKPPVMLKHAKLNIGPLGLLHRRDSQSLSESQLPL